MNASWKEGKIELFFEFNWESSKDSIWLHEMFKVNWASFEQFFSGSFASRRHFVFFVFFRSVDCIKHSLVTLINHQIVWRKILLPLHLALQRIIEYPLTYSWSETESIFHQNYIIKSSWQTLKMEANWKSSLSLLESCDKSVFGD